MKANPAASPLAWLTVTGGTKIVAASNSCTFSPQLEITILEIAVAVGQ